MANNTAQVAFERLWTVTEVAEYLRMSNSWVYKSVEAGTLPVRRLGTAVRFRPEDIRAYAAGEWQPKHTGDSVLRQDKKG